MSKKVYDKCGNRRLVTIAFRASVKESERLNSFVKASGMTKQDYIISRLECRDVTVQGNPKVFVGLKNLLRELNERLERIADQKEEPDQYLLDTINYITSVLYGMKGEKRDD